MYAVIPAHDSFSMKTFWFYRISGYFSYFYLRFWILVGLFSSYIVSFVFCYLVVLEDFMDERINACNINMKEKVLSNLYWILQLKVETERFLSTISLKPCQILPRYVCICFYVRGILWNGLLMCITRQILIYYKAPHIPWFHPAIWLRIFYYQFFHIFLFIDKLKGVLSFILYYPHSYLLLYNHAEATWRLKLCVLRIFKDYRHLSSLKQTQ